METMSLERFVNMFTTTVPDATAEEIADALWLAAGFPADPISSPGDLPRPSRHGRPEARRPEDLAPALRDLRRAAPGPGPPVFDEEATAARAACGVRLPALRPAAEHWLDLALVIDASSSMAIWQDTVREFRAALKSAGVFRHVRAWWLDTDTAARESFLLRDREPPSQSVAHSPEDLLDPNRHRVILIVTDWVGAAWRDRRAARLLEHGPTPITCRSCRCSPSGCGHAARPPWPRCRSAPANPRWRTAASRFVTGRSPILVPAFVMPMANSHPIAMASRSRS